MTKLLIVICSTMTKHPAVAVSEQKPPCGLLTLTSAGRAAHRRLAPKMLACEEALLGRLTPRERGEMLKGLALLEKALAIGPAEAENEGTALR